MTNILKWASIAVAALMVSSGAAMADGDAEAGKKVYNKCKACHDFDPAKKKIGPHLNGVVGRAAGAVEGYKYSDAMAGSGLVWDEATLDAFLEKPKDLVDGTKMAFPGLKDEEDRENVIAYIISMSQ